MRSLLHKLGYRFRKNVKGLPGRPDVVLPGRKKVVFVHGCFWHAHENCAKASIPRTRQDYWEEKLMKTRCRDAKNIDSLRAAGWEADVVWECELAAEHSVANRLKKFLSEPGKSAKSTPAHKRKGKA